MPLNQKLIAKGFSAALDSPIIAILAEHGFDQAVSILKQHFTSSAFDIASAFQQSYDEALAGIRTGLGANSKLAFVRKLIDSKLAREFSTQIEPYYF